MTVGLIVPIFVFAQSAPDSSPVATNASASVAAPAETTAASAPAPDPNSPLEFSDVVQVEGVSTTELYTRAKLWFAEAFRDSKHVLEVEDKEAGLLVGKGTMPYEPSSIMQSGGMKGHISFTVKIMIKDGRYKYSISNFTHGGSSEANQWVGVIRPVNFGLLTNADKPIEPISMTKGTMMKYWQQMKGISKAEAEGLIASMKKRMAQPAKGTDNW